jgi:hypothetical protein
LICCDEDVDEDVEDTFEIGHKKQEQFGERTH